MTAEFKEALAGGRKADVHSELNLEKELHPLLQALLTHLRRARETPLQFGIDSEGIVGAALNDFGISGEGSRRWEDWQLMTTALDKLVDSFLQEERKGRVAEDSSPPIPEDSAGTEATAADATGFDSNSSHPLVAWLDCLYAVMAEVQPRAIEILELRVEGFHDRDIAERLGLGLRLVRRIVWDIRANWLVAAGVSPAVEPGILPGGTRVSVARGADEITPSPGGRMPPSTAGGTSAATE